MKYLPLAIVLGILFNLFAVVFFKFKVVGGYREEISQLRLASDQRFERFASDVLSRVDAFLYSNVVDRAALSVTNSSGASPVLHEIVGRDFEYEYYFDGKPHANIDGSYLSVGDIFPRGGVITDINRDSILVSGRYLFIRPSRLRASSPLSATSTSQTKGLALNDN